MKAALNGFFILCVLARKVKPISRYIVSNAKIQKDLP
jgi:hypothetical protein